MHITVDKLYRTLTNCHRRKELIIADMDNYRFGAVAYDTDDDDNLCLYFEDCGDESGYTVEDLLHLLKDHKKEAGVYIACCGVYLDFVDEGGELLLDEHDEEDIIEFEVTKCGEYDLTSGRKPMPIIRKKRTHMAEAVVMVFIIFFALGCMGFNIYEIVYGTDHLWENILFILASVFMAGVNILTLRYLKD